MEVLYIIRLYKIETDKIKMLIIFYYNKVFDFITIMIICETFLILSIKQILVCNTMFFDLLGKTCLQNWLKLNTLETQ